MGRLCRRAENNGRAEARSSSISGEPVHLLVDSTGLKLCGAGEWLVEKHENRPILAEVAHRHECRHRGDRRHRADNK